MSELPDRQALTGHFGLSETSADALLPVLAAVRASAHAAGVAEGREQAAQAIEAEDGPYYLRRDEAANVARGTEEQQ